MEVARSFSHVLFVISSRREVTCPIAIWAITVREHVIIFSGPFNIKFGKGINVLTWGGIEQIELISIVLIDVFHDFIHAFEILKSIHISEIITKKSQYFIRCVMFSSL